MCVCTVTTPNSTTINYNNYNNNNITSNRFFSSSFPFSFSHSLFLFFSLLPPTQDEVGFANLPNCLPLQKHAFTVMAVGESGVGKSTFLNALFESGIFSSTGASALHDSGGGGSTDTTTTTVQRSTVELIENGVTLDLTVVDTPGFAAAVNNQDCWTAITDDIDKAFEGYMAAESKVLRSPVVQDDRVHCCLYFINPTGHGYVQPRLSLRQSYPRLLPVVFLPRGSSPFKMPRSLSRLSMPTESGVVHTTIVRARPTLPV